MIRRGSNPDSLYSRIKAIIEEARTNVLRTVNTEIVRAYWLIGRELVKTQQQGRARAPYGGELIETIAERLQNECGKGFTATNLNYMRLFYQTFPHLLSTENVTHRVTDYQNPSPHQRFVTHCVTNSSSPVLSIQVFPGHIIACRLKSNPITLGHSMRLKQSKIVGHHENSNGRSIASCTNGLPNAGTREERWHWRAEDRKFNRRKTPSKTPWFLSSLGFQNPLV